MAAVVNQFDQTRINGITSRWWSNSHFLAKRPILEAGVNAYLQATPEGYVNCIKNLATEVEGLLRAIYGANIPKGKRVTPFALADAIVSEMTKHSGSGESLLMSVPFLTYLRDVIFKPFDVTTGAVVLSRHSATHGVADAAEYTRERALQLILVLDQVFFSVPPYSDNKAS